MSERAFTLKQLAEITGAQLQGDPDCVISGVEALQYARPGDLSFFSNSRYRKHLLSTQASAVILKPADAVHRAGNALLSDNPYLSWARVLKCFQPPEERVSGIAADACIDIEAQIHETAFIDHGAVIGAGCVIEADVFIGPNCTLGKGVHVGQGTRLVANVVLVDGVSIGKRCLLHPGAVIGSDGFGLARDGERWVKVPQLGSVRIEDDVEIGANTTVDRGVLHDTLICKGAKLDNQIQIAHNVEIGENTAIAACTGISGSTRVGKNCTLAGGVGIVGHVELGDGVHVSGASVVSHSLKEPGVYTGGILAMPHKQWARNVARIKQLDALVRRVRELEKQIEKDSLQNDR